MNSLVYTLLPRLQTICIQHWMDSVKAGYRWTVVQAYRTPAEQMDLYKLGRTWESGIWKIIDKRAVRTNALPEESAHCRRVAYDIAVVVNGKLDWNDTAIYMAVAEIGKKLGLEWGGDWNALHHGDIGHYNLPDWKLYPIDTEESYA